MRRPVVSPNGEVRQGVQHLHLLPLVMPTPQHLAARFGDDSHDHDHHFSDPTSTATNFPDILASATTTTSSAPAATTTMFTVQLPTSTIVALGLGFVAAALLVLLLTVLARVQQVRRATRTARQRGEQVAFGQMWERMGGWWGYLFSQGERIGAGAGGWMPQRVVRMRPDRSTGSRWAKSPDMWEVDIARADVDALDELDIETCRPLCATPWPAQISGDQPQTQPEVALSVLILMPSPHCRTVSLDADVASADSDYSPLDDIPEMFIGTAHLAPTVPLELDADDPGSPSSGNKMEIEEIELGGQTATSVSSRSPREERRAQWVRSVQSWDIEGV